MSEPMVLLSGLGIPELPRWHEGRLWFCDWIDRQVLAVGLDGKPEVVLARDPARGTEGDITMTAATTVGGKMTVSCWQSPYGSGPIHVADVNITAIPVSTVHASGLAHLSKRSGLHAPTAPSRGVSSAKNH